MSSWFYWETVWDLRYKNLNVQIDSQADLIYSFWCSNNALIKTILKFRTQTYIESYEYTHGRREKCNTPGQKNWGTL